MKIALRRALIVLLVVSSTTLVSFADDKPRDEPEPRHRPPVPQPVPAADLEAALQRGVKYLLEDQNKDGSWGSPALKGGVPIIAGIGSHHAYQVAVTAMCVSALIESGGRSTSSSSFPACAATTPC
jgi:hypothetical protein